MPPVPQTVVPRSVALLYDGTNAADVLALAQQHYSIDPASWVSTSKDDDQNLAIRSSDRGFWPDIGIPIGWYAVATPGVQLVAVPAEVFTDRYVVLAP